MSDLPKPDYARNMGVVGHSDQGGRPDGVQIMVHRGFAYVGHMFSKGFSVIDVRDAKNPRAVNYVAASPNTWTIHLQTHDDLLLMINAKDMFAAAEFTDERAYYSGALGKTVGTAEARRERDWSAGLAVYHSGVERKLWAGPSDCTGGQDLSGLDGADLLSTDFTVGIVRCDEISFSILGLSFANMNVVLSLGLLVVWLLAARRA